MDKIIVNEIDVAKELNRVACGYIDEGDLDSAEEKLKEAIRLTPKLAEPYTNLGVLRCWDGGFDVSIALH